MGACDPTVNRTGMPTMAHGVLVQTPCQDTNKKQAKLSQQAELVKYLRDAGWKVQDPYIPLTGVAGTIYKKDLT